MKYTLHLSRSQFAVLQTLLLRNALSDEPSTISKDISKDMYIKMYDAETALPPYYMESDPADRVFDLTGPAALVAGGEVNDEALAANNS